MVHPSELPRLWRTLRPIPPRQLFARAAHAVRTRTFRHFPGVLARRLGQPATPALRAKLPPPLRDEAVLAQALRAAEVQQARLAGREVRVTDWAHPELPKLVRYHLQYLDIVRVLVEAGSYERGPLDFARGERERGPLDFARGERERGPLDFARGERERAPLDSARGERERGPLDSARGERERGPLDSARGERGPNLTAAGLALFEQWREENPPGGEGWEPYPVSARLQNLCLVAGWLDRPLPASLAETITLHARYLLAFPETHLSGNHLLKNHCALALAGLLFDGEEASQWRAVGLRRLREELRLQILPDGGHYERSPMYHLLVLADLLDVRDAARASGAPTAELEATLLRMARFAATVLHPDGEIPLFNDSVLGQAPAPAKLFARLGAVPELLPGPAVELPDSGLVVLRPSREEALLFDVGPLGPDHQPGHAHSDTLSYELSVGGARVVVNAGMDGYQSPNRPFFRSAVGHNTVTVNGEGPDELWAEFRVGGRMRVLSRQVEARAEWLIARGALLAHQGWRQARTLALLPSRALFVVDVLECPLPSVCVSRARLLPIPAAPRFVPLRGTPAQRATAYAPEFGKVFEISEQSVTEQGTRVVLAYALAFNARDLALADDGAGWRAVVDGVECAL